MNPGLRIAIRADASLLIGTGHIMRCLVVAERLKKEFNADIIFITRNHVGNLIEFIKNKGFAVSVLPMSSNADDVRKPYDAWLGASEREDIEQTSAALEAYKPDWVLFDHYALGKASHHSIKTKFKCGVAVIDDLAERPLECDVLIDHNCALDHPARYRNYIDTNTKCFFGPRYTPFRDELLHTAKNVSARRLPDGKKRIFLFLGGGDVFAPTQLVLRALFSLSWIYFVNIDVVVGMSCPNKDVLESFCRENENLRFFCQTPLLGELMAAADLAIGTGGINSAERCLLRLPAVTFALAENQKPGLSSYAALGCLQHLGDIENVTEESLAAAVNDLMFNESKLSSMKAACAKVIPLPGEQDGLSEICLYLKEYRYENR